MPNNSSKGISPKDLSTVREKRITSVLWGISKQICEKVEEDEKGKEKRQGREGNGEKSINK